MADEKHTALVIGASGLVGGFLIQYLIESDKYRHVRALVRHPLSLQSPKLETVIFDFAHPDATQVHGDDVFCTLGTTIKKAGSKQAFEQVDYAYPLTIATIAHKNGSKRFAVVTAMGADCNSTFYYNRVKGNLENKLKEFNFETLLIFRPSLLLGKRSEKRMGERVGSWFAKTFEFAIPAKYRAVEAAKVARAMSVITPSSVRGTIVYESDVLQEF